MPRDLVIGNGNLLICLDKHLHLRDLYYPHVGELNHIIGHYHRLGIWVDGQFSWLSYEDWHIDLGYKPDTLVTESVAINNKLGLKLTVNDAVLPDKDIYFRRIYVESLHPGGKPQEVRVFFCQDYYLYESDIGDTAFYDPHSLSVIHYKRNTYFLSTGLLNNKTPLSMYSCGTKKFHGAEGTWKDAEDGLLSQNPIAQGSVDSSLGFSGMLSADAPITVDYWIIAGENLKDVRNQNEVVLQTGCDAYLNQTESYWRNWVVSQVNLNLTELPPALGSLFKRSLLTIRTQADNDGAITAANDTDYFSFAKDTYSYMWPRDGAFVAYALDQTGHQDLTRRFFRFCHRIFTEGYDYDATKGDQQEAFFYHKYTPSGAVGSSWHPWIHGSGEPLLPIQEDETALILWSLWNHYQQYRDIEFVRKMYDEMIRPAGNFLCNFRDPKTGLPFFSYDLWEERFGIHTFTVATVYAGLQAAANFATVFGDIDNAVKYRETATEIKVAALKHLWCEEKGYFYRYLRLIKSQQFLQAPLALVTAGAQASTSPAAHGENPSGWPGRCGVSRWHLPAASSPGGGQWLPATVLPFVANPAHGSTCRDRVPPPWQETTGSLLLPQTPCRRWNTPTPNARRFQRNPVWGGSTPAYPATLFAGESVPTAFAG